MSGPLTMLAVGDLCLGMPDNAESYFEFVAPVLRSADIAVGQGEVTFTARGIKPMRMCCTPCDPKNISALAFAGFNVITLAGNHIWDTGTPGIEDTITGLKNYGIAFTGAGMNIDEARSPAVIERDGTRFGFLSYNCVGPEESWATPNKPGCAYLHVVVAYELDHPTPGIHPTIYTWAEPSSMKAMLNDIHKLRPNCDVLVVSLHKGIGHTPIKLADYEQQISYAAIDAGADLILGHHAHILKGIEQYKGKTIFHGLCNLVAFMPETDRASKGSDKKLRNELWGFEYDPEYPALPFHPDSHYTIIAKCTVEDGKISRVAYIPCFVNKKLQPEILKNDKKGKQVFDYMDRITRDAGLNCRYEWEDDEVLIRTD